MNKITNDIYIHSLNNCKYYIDNNYKQFETWDQIPYINKKTVITSKDSFIVPNNFKDNIITKTSGSTGISFDTYWTRSDYTKSLLTLWNLRIKNKIYPNDKFCTFHSFFNAGENISYNFINYNKYENCLSFNKLFLDDEHLLVYIKEINDFKPKWLFMQPNILLLLMNCYKNNKIDPPKTIKYIELTGEILLSSVRNEIEEFFNVKVINNYASQEFNCIAYQCECGNLHINEDNVYVELDENNNIIITCLLNYLMPFIKYNIGDVANYIEKEHGCGCKNKSPIISLKNARQTDQIVIDNKHYDSSLFFYLFEKINLQLNFSFIQFYIEQINKKFVIYLLPKNKNEKCNINHVKDLYKNELKILNIDIDFDVVVGNEMPLNKSGKLNYFNKI